MRDEASPRKPTLLSRATLGRLLLRSSLAIALIAVLALVVSPVKHELCDSCLFTHLMESSLTDESAQTVEPGGVDGARNSATILNFEISFPNSLRNSREHIEAWQCSGVRNCRCLRRSPVDDWIEELTDAITPTPPQTAAPANPAVTWRNLSRIR